MELTVLLFAGNGGVLIQRTDGAAPGKPPGMLYTGRIEDKRIVDGRAFPHANDLSSAFVRWNANW